MKIGFLFSGQGSQYPGMGKDIYDAYEKAKEAYEEVQKITGIDIKKICFTENNDLDKMAYTQVAVLANSLAVLNVLKSYGINPNVSAGLSLGEYTALISSGALSIEDGIALVQKRGELMEKYLPKGKWKMAAVMGLGSEEVIDSCQKEPGFVWAVNFNCPGQIIISGEEEAVNSCANRLQENGAKVMFLNTAGPFHTSLFEESKEALRDYLENINFNDFKSLVLKNIDGTYYTKEDNIKEVLADHLVSPVHFEKEITKMLEDGINVFIEIGPSKSLSGFVKRTALKENKKVTILKTQNASELAEVISYFGKGE